MSDILPPAVRILPMDSVEEFHGQTGDHVQKEFFLKELPSRENCRYLYIKRGLTADPGTVVLFQYDNRIIATAVLTGTKLFPTKKDDRYDGALFFDPASIRVFEPVTPETIHKIWPEFKGFSYVKWILDPNGYPRFLLELKGVHTLDQTNPERKVMSTTQHQLAHSILSMIRDANPPQRFLTYEGAAVELGRPTNHARAIAQACDLLDAAAALAGVPLLALYAVRIASGDINPKAWKNDVPDDVRDAIIRRSAAHVFTDTDYHAIGAALDELAGCGNKAAWKEVRRRIPQLEQKLSEVLTVQTQDAVNDIGSDRVEKVTVTGTQYLRDPKVRRDVERRAEGKCEYCGKQGFERLDGTHYVETHHIIALADEGADRVTNVIAVCPEHHREAHYGARSKQLEEQMKAKVEEFYRHRSESRRE